MKTKARISATLPDYVVAEIEKHGIACELTKSEYLTLIARKWYADGCPPVSPDEARLRGDRAGTHAKRVFITGMENARK